MEHMFYISRPPFLIPQWQYEYSVKADLKQGTQWKVVCFQRF